ncbi:putative Fe-S protein YdhL (DUF1289 family) [Herbaspirillum sp. Sphag1AN]|uniref:DUF3106 domain-containing protein n=1 Tax=unclassified Herbaspirillum TaxID=2624150 RepID=UPI0016197E1E|nr:MULTISPECIES: DUF3106 domain-containing protein [unclassified Herbaspirillum]MBB3212063.1 putative Fe-S protein YdhL (DUF1289 family) [Herbaspirillum sp. Sphag1AN]MBB3244103.1 putative Fe-S protein YdhL (DUF1289 family) [Herbaspirillum sp. Sphag64]
MGFILTFLRNASRRSVCLCVATLSMLVALVSVTSWAQGPAASAHSTTPSKAAAKKPESKPTWNELTPSQQQALAPLANEWNKMESGRKEKWLVIGNKFASMTPEQQSRLQERMREWIKLTPAQRRAIRESYARAKKLNAEKKSAQWLQYQQLSDEQKKKLAESKPPKHVASIPTARPKAPLKASLPPEALEQPLSTNPGTPAAPVTIPTETK